MTAYEVHSTFIAYWINLMVVASSRWSLGIVDMTN